MNQSREWIHWKWTLGEIYDRSKRVKRVVNEKEPQNNHILKQCLLSEEECWRQENTLAQQSIGGDDNKREDTNNRMSQREWTIQTGINPYSNNNYMDDLIVQETFLKPINSQIDRLNTKEEEKMASFPKN